MLGCEAQPIKEKQTIANNKQYIVFIAPPQSHYVMILKN